MSAAARWLAESSKPGLVLGTGVRAGAQVHLGERRDRLGGIGVVAGVERGRDGALQVDDRTVRVSEQEGQAAEVVQHARRVVGVAVELVELVRLLGVAASEEELTAALRDQRPLEGEVSDGAPVPGGVGELEPALDVAARRVPVALALVAAAAPLEDACPEPV
jgi:hypothetical protein